MPTTIIITVYFIILYTENQLSDTEITDLQDMLCDTEITDLQDMLLNSSQSHIGFSCISNVFLAHCDIYANLITGEVIIHIIFSCNDH